MKLSEQSKDDRVISFSHALDWVVRRDYTTGEMITPLSAELFDQTDNLKTSTYYYDKERVYKKAHDQLVKLIANGIIRAYGVEYDRKLTYQEAEKRGISKYGSRMLVPTHYFEFGSTDSIEIDHRGESGDVVFLEDYAFLFLSVHFGDLKEYFPPKRTAEEPIVQIVERYGDDDAPVHYQTEFLELMQKAILHFGAENIGSEKREAIKQWLLDNNGGLKEYGDVAAGYMARFLTPDR